jgi:hypothetical protein
VDDPFIRQIVGIEEERLPIGRKRAVINSESVVLRSGSQSLGGEIWAETRPAE